MALVADAWLSELLEKPAFHWKGSSSAFRTADLPEGQSFVDAKVPVDDVDELLGLQAAGFRVIDTKVQLARPAGAVTGRRHAVRFARDEDEAAVRTLSGEAMRENRFWRDPSIPEPTAVRLKEEWAGNFFHGKRGEWMVVADLDGGIGGFVQLLRGPDDVVVIDLIAVDERHRGKGVARALIAYAAEACLGRPAAMLVGTQVANVPSLALYVGLGFRVSSSSYVLHLHDRGEIREDR